MRCFTVISTGLYKIGHLAKKKFLPQPFRPFFVMTEKMKYSLPLFLVAISIRYVFSWRSKNTKPVPEGEQCLKEYVHPPFQ